MSPCPQNISSSAVVCTRDCLRSQMLQGPTPGNGYMDSRKGAMKLQAIHAQGDSPSFRCVQGDLAET